MNAFQERKKTVQLDVSFFPTQILSNKPLNNNRNLNVE